MIERIIWWIQDWLRQGELGGLRSNQWARVRRSFIEKNPTCAVCGRKSNLLKSNEIHHCQPFHLKPELELLESNLITLCREHHLLFGHLMNFKSFNSNVREDSGVWKERIANRPLGGIIEE